MSGTEGASNPSAAGAPLAGLKVLDLSRVFAGPVAGRVLADLGADVVKVEPPEGDVTRLWGHKAAGISTYYAQQNYGKRNISVDLTQPDGPTVVRELAGAADILIENFRPGVLARFGLDWKRLSSINPALVMASISGFGQDGPESSRAAYAAVIHAEAGLVRPERASGLTDLTFSAADVLSGLHGVIGILAALRVRESTGVGQYIDIAMVEAMAFSTDSIMESLDDRIAESKGGEVWQTAAGPVMLTGGLRWIWHQMHGVHGVVDPTPEGATLEQKLTHRRAAVTDFLCALPGREAVLATLDEAGLAWGELRQLGQVLESPTLQRRASVLDVDDRAGGTRHVVRSPYHMSESETVPVGRLSHRGEHNDDVLSEWLDAGDDRRAELRASGVLLEDEWAEQRRNERGDVRA